MNTIKEAWKPRDLRRFIVGVCGNLTRLDLLPFAELLGYELALPPIQFLSSNPKGLSFIVCCDAPEFLSQHIDLFVNGDEVGTIVEVGFHFGGKGLQQLGMVME